MGTTYRQFCPVAKAMELLDERWTMLLVRELVLGSEHFNDLRRGLPRMSPTLLSKRLHQLVRAGVVEKRIEGTDVRYVLTPAGEELRPVVEAVGAWGARWIGELGDEDLDPKLLLWDMRRNVDREAVPPTRTVVHFRFPDVPGVLGRWWMVLTRDDADLCDQDPGHDVDVEVTATLRDLTDVWRGESTWAAAVRAGRVTMTGTSPLRRDVPKWFPATGFALVSRAQGSLVRV
ncbi:MAG: helix-turn-helix domain-containing protein [Nocardioides sp.]